MCTWKIRRRLFLDNPNSLHNIPELVFFHKPMRFPPAKLGEQTWSWKLLSEHGGRVVVKAWLLNLWTGRMPKFSFDYKMKTYTVCGVKIPTKFNSKFSPFYNKYIIKINIKYLDACTEISNFETVATWKPSTAYRRILIIRSDRAGC